MFIFSCQCPRVKRSEKAGYVTRMTCDAPESIPGSLGKKFAIAHLLHQELLLMVTMRSMPKIHAAFQLCSTKPFSVE